MDPGRTHRATPAGYSALRSMPASIASAAQRTRSRAHALKFANGVRSLGAPNFPDPTTDNPGVLVLHGINQNPRPIRRMPARAARRLRAVARTLAGGTLTRFAASDPCEADRCFVAYAAHELRGSITLQRTLAEVALANPNADTAAVRQIAEKVAAACERQDRLLEALLTLARSEYGRLPREPIDLSVSAAEILRIHTNRELTGTTALELARTTGNPQLIERLAANLVGNAVRHNIPGGRIDVAAYTAAGPAALTIANTGPVIPTGQLPRLFQPLQRLGSHTGPLAQRGRAWPHHRPSRRQRPRRQPHRKARTGGGLRIDIDFPADTRPKPLVAETQSVHPKRDH